MALGITAYGRHKFFTFLKKGLKYIVRKKELKRIPIHNDLEIQFRRRVIWMWRLLLMRYILKINDIAIFFTGTRTFATDYLFKNDKESVCFFLKIIFQPN